MRAAPFALLLIAAPVQAGAGTPIPEPSNLALFGLGLAGLVIGRRMAARRKSPDKDRSGRD
ncbi:PEP-CTERM sorting domain-containing protein [Pelagerythrobacter sp.]|uniref:PEP-CTERM sorting domain-containing protein n=1 Tax=Pelagerythrobacter sp. TaxID=2800702 RepID=UPI0035B47383